MKLEGSMFEVSFTVVIFKFSSAFIHVRKFRGCRLMYDISNNSLIDLELSILAIAGAIL